MTVSNDEFIEPLDLSALVPSFEDDEPIIEPDASKSKERKKYRGPFNKPSDISTDAPKRTVKKPVPRPRKGQFVDPLMKMYAGIGMVSMSFDSVCATAILENAEGCARALDDLAYQNDAVRRALITITSGSATTAVFIAHLPILMAITMHHVPKAKTILGNFAPKDDEMPEPVAEEVI